MFVELIYIKLCTLFQVSARPNHSSGERNRAKSAQGRDRSAPHGAAHQSYSPHKSSIPSSTVRSRSVITDGEGMNLKQEWTIDAKNTNIRKILTARKFSMRKARKRHKAVVSPYTTEMSSSASLFKEAFASQTLQPTFVTGK